MVNLSKEQLVQLVRFYARQYGIDESIALKQIEKESSWSITAGSPAGAKGLFQFIPDTARRYGLRVDRFVDERLDPVKAGRAWGAYMRDLLGMFGGRYDLALAGYNWGEHRDQLKDAYKSGRSVFDYVIPAETRDYVKTILGGGQTPTVTGNPGGYQLAKYTFDASKLQVSKETMQQVVLVLAVIAISVAVINAFDIL